MKQALVLVWITLFAAAGVVAAGPSSPSQSAQAASKAPAKSSRGTKTAKVDDTLRVDLNHADAAELAKLPGIGEQVAKRIIAYRTDNGPFQKTEEIMNVRGIGEKTYLKLRPFLTLGSDKESQKK